MKAKEIKRKKLKMEKVILDKKLKIQCAIEMLNIFFESSAPFDIVMAKFFKKNKWIGSHERKVTAEFCYAVFRKYETLKFLTEKITENLGRFFVLSYLKISKYNSDEIEEIFSWKNAKSITDFEKKFILDIDRKINDKNIPKNVILNYPKWIEPFFHRAFPQNFDEEIKAMNEKATVDLRANTLKSNADEVLEILAESNLKAEKTKLSENGIRILNGRISRNHEIIKNGLAEIQDEGSQLIAEICGASPKDTVIDYCAGAGGKTLALAASMNNKGRIFALDKYGERLENAKLRLKRAGVNNATCLEISTKWLKRHYESADIVLVDAPCSGTGTWRRNPDMRARFKGINELEELMKLQAEILKTAAPLVKVGGKLIYSTCSVLIEENDKQIEKFLTENEGKEGIQFKQIPFSTRNNFRNNNIFDKDFLRLSPFKNGTDGFFAACLERTE